MPFGGSDQHGSRWVTATWAAGAGTSADIRYPVNGQGSNTATASAAATFLSTKVIITGIYILTWDTTTGNILQFTNQAGTDITNLVYQARASINAERGIGGLHIELDSGFGIRPQSDVLLASLVVLVAYVPVK